MKRILLVAATTGYQTRMFAEACQRLGHTVTLATDRCHVLDDPWGDGAIAVRFDQPQRSADQLLEAHPRFDAVVAVGDKPAILAAYLNAKLGLRGHAPAAVETCRNKHAMREAFAAAGLAVPEFALAPIDSHPAEFAPQAPYPCVLKPLGLSASRGVIRANNEQEFVAAFDRIARLLRQPEFAREDALHTATIQVEAYIEGSEYALEGLLTNGELTTLALFDKPDPLDGPFFEETIYVTPSRTPERIQALMRTTVERAAGALGLTHGPIHAEFRLNDDGVWMLEIAARPIGGLCAKAVRFSGGLGLEDVLVRHALGETAVPAPDGEARGVMMIPIPARGIYRGVEGVDQARHVPGVEDIIITATPGQLMIPLPEGASYLGFIFALAATPAGAEAALRHAHTRLRFDLAAVLPVSGPSN